MRLWNARLPQNTGAVFAFCLNGKKLPRGFVLCCKFCVTVCAVPFIFVLNRKTSTQTGGFNKYFVTGTLELLFVFQPLQEQIIESAVVFDGEEIKCESHV